MIEKQRNSENSRKEGVNKDNAAKEMIIRRFWEKNLKLITVSIFIWFTVSYGIVILLGDILSKVKLFGSTLPFWFGQQGSIIVFFVLVLNYAVRMDQITELLKKEYLKNTIIDLVEKGA
jgi:putative solute:sodium symporter small subunit